MGFGAAVAPKLLPQLKKPTREANPFAGANAPKNEPSIRWLNPSLVAAAELAGWTGMGMIGQASIKRLRRDKPASEMIAGMPGPVQSGKDEADETLAAVVKQRRARTAVRSRAAANTPARTSPVQKGAAVVMGVPISKPDKELWPDAGDGEPVTKLDLAKYYEAVGEWLLPHLRGRPCSLLRAPDGLGGEQFFQRHAMAGISKLFTLAKVKGDKAPYVQIDRIGALAAVAQIGALEMHPWNCAPHDPEMAGRLVFDLDPAPDVKFAAVIAAALEIRERLSKVGLQAFCKTTGSKGLHVVSPLRTGGGAVGWPAAKNFAHLICSQMAQDSPGKYLDTMSKNARVGRIFLDYLRNDRSATAVAVLSSRARSGATVSMPVPWQQVKAGLDPTRYTVRTAPGILRRSKPWNDYARAAQPLALAIRKLTAS